MISRTNKVDILMTFALSMALLMTFAACHNIKNLLLERNATATPTLFAGDYLAGVFATNNMMYEDGVFYLDRAEKAMGSNPALSKRIFYSALFDGQIDIARRYGAQAIIADDNGGGADRIKIFLAFDHMNGKNYQQARKLLLEVMQDPDNAISDFIATMGYAWCEVLSANNDKPGIDILDNKLLNENKIGQSAFIIYNKAMMHDFIGNIDLAKPLYAKLITHAVPNRVLEVCLNFFSRIQDNHTVELIRDKILKKDVNYDNYPRNLNGINLGLVAREIFLDIATIMQMDNMSFDAMVYLFTASNIKLDDDRILFTLASIMHLNGLYEYSNKIYARISSGSRYHLNSLINMAYNYYYMGQKDLAYRILLKESSSYPESFELNMSIGDIYSFDQRCDRALEYYTHAIKIYDEDKDYDLDEYDIQSAYFARAVCFDARDEWRKAKDDLQKSLEIDRANPAVLNYLGYSLIVKENNPDAAIKLLEEAMSYSNNDPHVIDSLGWAYYKKGECGTAMQLLEIAAMALPYDPVVNDHLGDVYWCVDRKKEAGFQWNKTLMLDVDQQMINAINNKINNGAENKPLEK